MRQGTGLADVGLSLETSPDRSLDLLQVDAFSSDRVPTHLLAAETMRTYSWVIEPNGVILLHLSNHNFELEEPDGPPAAITVCTVDPQSPDLQRPRINRGAFR